jgi:hypothetical protein
MQCPIYPIEEKEVSIMAQYHELKNKFYAWIDSAVLGSDYGVSKEEIYFRAERDFQLGSKVVDKYIDLLIATRRAKEEDGQIMKARRML